MWSAAEVQGISGWASPEFCDGHQWTQQPAAKRTPTHWLERSGNQHSLKAGPLPWALPGTLWPLLGIFWPLLGGCNSGFCLRSLGKEARASLKGDMGLRGRMVLILP